MHSYLHLIRISFEIDKLNNKSSSGTRVRNMLSLSLAMIRKRLLSILCMKGTIALVSELALTLECTSIYMPTIAFLIRCKNPTAYLTIETR